MKKLLLGSLMFASVATYAQTTKKVIIEDYTGLNCGWCPEGTVVLEGLRSANPTSCIPVAVHTGSYEPGSSSLNMAATFGNALTSTLKVLGYPAGAVNRKSYPAAGYGHDTIAMGRGSWTGAFNTEKAKTAIASISFSGKVDKTGGNYECDVNVTFSALPPAGVPVVVQLILIEDSIAATGSLAQHNYSSAVQGGADPLSPWYHNRTLRWSASGDAWGFTGVVPATPVVGTKYTKHVTFSIGSWVKKNINVVAYVALNGSAVNDQKEILQAEEVSLNSFFPTGVENVNTPVNVMKAYPNPAKLDDVVKLEYTISENATVTMKVYNTVGQVVAQPIQSYEAAGSHSMQWKASEYNLTPGVYFMEVSTPQGKQTQRICLQ